MFPTVLNPDRLYLFVLGPSAGESIIVRVPDNTWLVVDSFRHNGRPAASYVLETYRATWSALVLTHPHADHYPGIDDLLASNPRGTVGCVHPRGDDLSTDELPLDPMRHLGRGALPVYDAIRQRWDRSPGTRWETYRHEVHRVGDAELIALHPVRPLTDADWARHPNELSSAILLRWERLTLLLGADVENLQWSGIARDFPHLNQHHGLKVPHHGSPGAIHESYAEGDPDRCWVVTPWRRGWHRLPGAGDGEGLDLMLRRVTEVHVTALPFSHDREQEDPCVATRESIRDEDRPKPAETVLPSGKHGLVASTSTTVDRHVVVEFDRRGLVGDIFHGPGSVRVTRAGGRPPQLSGIVGSDAPSSDSSI
jgi:hypothetical protein